MKLHLFFLGILCILSACGQPQQFMDTEAELASIEVTREAFTTAIKEGRYQDLEKWTAQGAILVGPAEDGWIEMYQLGQERGAFPYDSIRMAPQQTIILNDSIAYDFGISTVYYTNAEGEVVVLDNTFMAMLKKERDGVWRLWREVASGQVQ